MEPAVASRLSLADYQELETTESIRYEYHDGEVFAMAGGSPKHGAIASNITVLISNHLAEGCRAFNSDVKVYVASVNKGLYPDLSVACRPIELKKEVNAITSPILLVEVLSESTADYDRGAKFRHYSQLASLREYVLVEQQTWTVETRYRRDLGETWEMNWFEGEVDELLLRSLNIKLPIRDIYRATEGL